MERLSKGTIWMVFLLLFFSLLWVAKSAFQRVDKLRFEQNNEQIEVTQQYFVSSVNKYTSRDYVAMSTRFNATEFNKTQIDLGELDVWYRLILANIDVSTLDLVMMFDNPMLDYIDIYEETDQSLHLVSRLGDKREVDNIELWALPHIKTLLSVNQSKTYIIKTRSKGTPNMPIALFVDDDFERYKSTLYLIWGSFIGIVFLMIVYNLILFLGVKDTSYILYVSYISSFLLALGVVHGFLIYLVPKTLFVILSDSIILLLCIVSAATIAFAIRFLKFDIWATKGLRFLRSLIYLAIFCVGLVSIFVPEYQAATLFFMLQTIVYIFSLWLVGGRLIHDFSWAKYYVVSWLPLFVGAAVGPLLLTGYLEYNFWTRHALLFGVLFEMTFISMALAEKLRMSENDRLYHATHDKFLGLGNITVLAQGLDKNFSREVTPEQSLVSLKIEHYHQITPYLDKSNLNEVIRSFLLELESFFIQRVPLQILDPDNEIKHIVSIKDGSFAFILHTSDVRILKQIQSDFKQFVPFTHRLLGFNVSFSCYCSCLNLDEFNSSEEIIDYNFGAMQFVEKTKVLFQITNKLAINKFKIAAETPRKISELRVVFLPIINPIGDELFAMKADFTLANGTNLNILDLQFSNEIDDNIDVFYLALFDKVCQSLDGLPDTGKRYVVDLSHLLEITKAFISGLVPTLNQYSVKADMFILEIGAALVNRKSLNSILALQEIIDLGFELSIEGHAYGISTIDWIKDLPIRIIHTRADAILRYKVISNSQTQPESLFKQFEKLNLTVIVRAEDKEKKQFKHQRFLGGIYDSDLSLGLSSSNLKEYIDDCFLSNLSQQSKLLDLVERKRSKLIEQKGATS